MGVKELDDWLGQDRGGGGNAGPEEFDLMAMENDLDMIEPQEAKRVNLTGSKVVNQA